MFLKSLIIKYEISKGLLGNKSFIKNGGGNNFILYRIEHQLLIATIF